MLFKNEFLLFQFRFKPKISSCKLFPSEYQQNQAENKAPLKTVQKLLLQRKIMRKLHSVEEKGLLMQYHSIIKKLPKQLKNKVSNVAY